MNNSAPKLTSRISRIDLNEPVFKIGATGNYYVICNNREKLVPIAEVIGKAPSSIYFNKRHRCYTIRIKAERHKKALQSYMNTDNDNEN